jgi:hypothetical protein
VLHQQRGTKLCIIAPRGSAKSTWASYAYPLYCGKYQLERYTILISDTGRQATAHLRNIKRTVEKQWPQLIGRTWRKDYIELANGCLIEALGTGGRIRGARAGEQRPSLIIVDDPQNKDHIYSALQRERTMDWFNADVMNAGDGSTNFMVLGTVLHRDCLVLELSRRAGWEHKTFRAIGKWPQRMDLWAAWQLIFQDYADPEREAKAWAFYQANRDAMHE